MKQLKMSNTQLSSRFRALSCERIRDRLTYSNLDARLEYRLLGRLYDKLYTRLGERLGDRFSDRLRALRQVW